MTCFKFLSVQKLIGPESWSRMESPATVCASPTPLGFNACTLPPYSTPTPLNQLWSFGNPACLADFDSNGGAPAAVKPAPKLPKRTRPLLSAVIERPAKRCAFEPFGEFLRKTSNHFAHITCTLKRCMPAKLLDSLQIVPTLLELKRAAQDTTWKDGECLTAGRVQLLEP